MSAYIVGIGETARVRHPEPSQSTLTFMRDAAMLAMRDVGLGLRDIDGFAVASFSLEPDRAVDVAWRLGLSVRWLLQDTNGGASAINTLGHAIRGEWQDFANAAEDIGEQRLTECLSLYLRIAGYIVIDIAGQTWPTVADVREVAQRMATTDLDFDLNEGDAHAYLMSVYKDPLKPENLRIDAAKAAIRYERPALSHYYLQGVEGRCQAFQVHQEERGLSARDCKRSRRLIAQLRF